MNKDKLIALMSELQGMIYKQEQPLMNKTPFDARKANRVLRLMANEINKINSGDLDEEAVKSECKLVIELEEHIPINALENNPCSECVLKTGIFGCLDKSLCKYKETGKTWVKKLSKCNPTAIGT